MDQPISLNEIKSVEAGILMSSKQIAELTDEFLEIERRLEDSCATELELHNTLVLAAEKLRAKVNFF